MPVLNFSLEGELKSLGDLSKQFFEAILGRITNLKTKCEKNLSKRKEFVNEVQLSIAYSLLMGFFPTLRIQRLLLMNPR